MELQSIHEFDTLLRPLGLMDVGAEVGCAECRSSLEFLQMGVEKLFLIDVWEHIPNVSGDGNSPESWHQNNFSICQSKLKNYSDRVIFLKGFSTEMAKRIPNKYLGFVYLDAAHDYANVLKDLEAYVPKVREGGIVAGHDFLSEHYQVKQAVEEFCKDKYEVHLIPEKSKENAGFWFMKKEMP